jgi:poly-gamma-glutamate synthesis protein (capsule biosynthesis protein)
MELSITAAGDIAFNDDIIQKLRGDDPFRFVRNEIVSSDISIANLECVLSDEGKPSRTWVNIRSKTASAEYLKIFTILCLANNHILDYGSEGMNNTINVLNKNGILTLGAGSNYQEAIRPLIIKRNSLKVGVINFAESRPNQRYFRSEWLHKPGPARYYEKYVLEQIRKLKNTVDIVIASIHWGVEYVYFPSPQQQTLARKLVDNGVDLIIGHHPHVIQGIEKYKNGLIFYSLGNLIFDFSISNVRESMIARICISSGCRLDYELIPLELNNNYQPIKLSGQKKEDILNFIEDISTPLVPAVSEYFWFEQASEICLKSYKSSYVTLMKKYGIKPVIPFFLGLVSPYLIKHYAGFIRHKLRSLVV